jgi:hypothetical protein
MCIWRSYTVFNSFFLVYAAHVMIAGIAWRMWAQPGTSHDQDMETTAINTALRVLDFCGQRNTFARKYSLLIKELRSQLDGGPSSAGPISFTTTASSVSSASPFTNSQMVGVQNTSSPGSGSISHGELLGRLGLSTEGYAINGQESGANQTLASVEPSQRSLLADFDDMSFDPSWLEQPRASDPAGSPLFPGAFLSEVPPR